MKNSSQCPKCSGKEIVRIPGRSGPYGSGNHVPAGLTIFGSVKVTRYLCGQCGFSEEWIEDVDGIGKLKRKYGTS